MFLFQLGRFIITDTEKGRTNKKRGVEIRILPVFLFQLTRFIVTDTVRGRGNIKGECKKGGR